MSLQLSPIVLNLLLPELAVTSLQFCRRIVPTLSAVHYVSLRSNKSTVSTATRASPFQGTLTLPPRPPQTDSNDFASTVSFLTDRNVCSDRNVCISIKFYQGIVSLSAGSFSVESPSPCCFVNFFVVVSVVVFVNSEKSSGPGVFHC
jgi:hypothetical protein